MNNSLVQVSFFSNTIFSPSHSGSCLKTLGDRQASVNSLFVDDSKVFCACEDNKVRVWNFLPSTRRRQRAAKAKRV